MVDDCVIRRPSTSSEFNSDPAVLDYVSAPPTTVYGGTGRHADDKCRIHGYQPQESTPDSGQHVFTVQRYFISIPIGKGPVAVNDVIEITGALLDAANVGRKFRIASLFNKTFATAQRLMVDEVTA